MAVALLGTGIMGQGMARSLQRAGLAVRAWNRTLERAAPLAGAGITVTDRPGDAIAGADTIITMLYDLEVVTAVIEQVDAPEGTLWLQTSTVGIDGADRLAGIAAQRRWTYVDAPVLGTRGPAENGELVVLASGPEEARDRSAEVFDAIGSRTLWVGPAGSGSRLKLAVNAWIATITVGTAQSVNLTRGLGLDPALFLEAISGTATDSPYAKLKGRAMIDDDFTPNFSVSNLAKDSGLITAAAHRAGIDGSLAEAVESLFQQAVQQGYGGQDAAAVTRIFRK
jgi:3-hydroxyisobutyrate dehydrogenase